MTVQHTKRQANSKKPVAAPAKVKKAAAKIRPTQKGAPGHGVSTTKSKAAAKTSPPKKGAPGHGVSTAKSKAAAKTRPAKKGAPDHGISTAKLKAAAKTKSAKQTTKTQGARTIRKKTSENTQVTKHTATAHTSTVTLSPQPAKKSSAKFSPTELAGFRKDLLDLHERLTTQIGKMRQSALKRDDEVNHEEDGSDAFDRLFTLERAGVDQKTINQITNALRAIKEGTYGVCELCNGLIESARLHALPFVKNCVSCQSELERQRTGRSAAPRRVVP